MTPKATGPHGAVLPDPAPEEGRPVVELRGGQAEHLRLAPAEHPLGTHVEDGDGAGGVGGDDGLLGRAGQDPGEQVTRLGGPAGAGALLRDDDVCPSEDVQRRRRVRFREDCITERIAQPEAGDGDTELAVRARCVSAQRLRATKGTYNGGCGAIPSTRNGGYRCGRSSCA